MDVDFHRFVGNTSPNIFALYRNLEPLDVVSCLLLFIVDDGAMYTNFL